MATDRANARTLAFARRVKPRCECPCGCRADATTHAEAGPWLACDACRETGVAFGWWGDAACGRRTEDFTRCHVCHELISWDPREQKEEDGERWLFGACRCGSTAWRWKAWKSLSAYQYAPSDNEVVSHQEDEVDETPDAPLLAFSLAKALKPTMTPSAARAVIAWDWGRRAMVILGWVAGAIVVLCAFFLWNNEIGAFLASRPTWEDLIFWGFILYVFRRAPRALRQWRRRAVARRKGPRTRALRAAWAVLRPPHPRGDAAGTQQGTVTRSE